MEYKDIKPQLSVNSDGITIFLLANKKDFFIPCSDSIIREKIYLNFMSILKDYHH